MIDVPASLSPEQTEAVDKLSEVMNGNPRAKLFRSPQASARTSGLMAALRRVRTTTTTRVEVSSDRGVFMISVAAELADMHPQTLRMYEARGLIEPKRSPKGTRLYSHQDVERLRRIQEMTAELGMNLAGVERVFELEEQLESMSRKVACARAAGRGADGRGGAARGAAPRAARRDRSLHPGRRARPQRRREAVPDPGRAGRVGSGRVRPSGQAHSRLLRPALHAARRSGVGPFRAHHQSRPGSGRAVVRLLLPLTADRAGLRRFALAVTTPGSPEYAQYESIPALARRFGASATVRSAVLSRLRAAGATSAFVDATGLFARTTLTAGAAAQRCSPRRWRATGSSDGPRFIAPTRPTSVPRSLRGLVTGVVGLDTRPLFRAPAAQPSSIVPHSGTANACPAAVATGGFTPNQYLTAYGFDPLHNAGITGQGERVALIEIDGFKHSDITNFARCFGLRVPPIRAFGIGVRKALPPGGETTLDLEVLTAAAPGLKAIDVYQSRPLAATRCTR